MKTVFAKMSAVALIALSLGACANNNMGLTTQQRNAAIGVAAGAVAGNLLGDSTAATLGGAALGGVIGSQIQ